MNTPLTTHKTGCDLIKILPMYIDIYEEYYKQKSKQMAEGKKIDPETAGFVITLVTKVLDFLTGIFRKKRKKKGGEQPEEPEQPSQNV